MGWNDWLALALVAVGVWTIGDRVKIIRNNRLRGSWDSISGHVLSSEVQEHVVDTGDGYVKTYTPHIVYQYEIGGRKLSGSRHSSDNAGLSKKKAKAFVDKYPAGSKIPVYVNPQDAADALLKRGDHVDWFGPVLFFTMAAATAAGAFGS